MTSFITVLTASRLSTFLNQTLFREIKSIKVAINTTICCPFYRTLAYFTFFSDMLPTAEVQSTSWYSSSQRGLLPDFWLSFPFPSQSLSSDCRGCYQSTSWYSSDNLSFLMILVILLISLSGFVIRYRVSLLPHRCSSVKRTFGNPSHFCHQSAEASILPPEQMIWCNSRYFRSLVLTGLLSVQPNSIHLSMFRATHFLCYSRNEVLGFSSISVRGD